MCGRYALFSPKTDIENHFQATFKDNNNYTPSWNISPGTSNPTALLGKARVPGLTHMRWGLVPEFAKDTKISFNMFNARSETIDEKPSFSKPFRRKRCLIPANGFYEWKNIEGSKIKIPFYIKLIHNELFAFAGIYESWVTETGEYLYSYSIITTEANALLEPLHERMPVILEPEQYASWVDPLNSDMNLLKSYFKPYPMQKMRLFRVNEMVNKSSINTPDLIEPYF